MRKETRLKIKREAVKEELQRFGGPLYGWNVFTDDDLALFSEQQLHAICRIMKQTVELMEKSRSFATLDVNRALHKPTGRIVHVDDDGSVWEETEEEVLSSAAASIYKMELDK